jgi:hypothetical protein
MCLYAWVTHYCSKSFTFFGVAGGWQVHSMVKLCPWKLRGVPRYNKLLGYVKREAAWKLLFFLHGNCFCVTDEWAFIVWNFETVKSTWPICCGRQAAEKMQEKWKVFFRWLLWSKGKRQWKEKKMFAANLHVGRNLYKIMQHQIVYHY